MRNQARPRYETKATPYSKLAQKPLLEASLTLGFTPMPWQRKGIRLLGELRPPTEEEIDQFGPLVAKGVPRYRQVLLTVPRQSGKSTVAQAFIKARAESQDKQRLYGTSKTRDDARLWQAELNLLLPEVHYTTAAGRETITWGNGSTYSIFAPNKKGGHSATADGVLIDEAWTLTSEVLQGIIPAMAARPLSQLLIVTTMGDMTSTVWNGLVKLGRESIGDPTTSMAYVEYSAEHEDDVFNPDKWGTWMPSLGITQSRSSIKADMALMEADPNEGLIGIVRAYGNITTATKVTLFPQEWLTDAWSVIQPPERLVVAVDVNDEPPGATVATGHIAQTGQVAARVVEWRYGSPVWVPDLVKRMITERTVDAVVADFGGPAREIRTELQAVCGGRGVALVDRVPRDLAADAANFYDGLREHSLVLEKSAPLVESIEGSARKNLGDLWVISRRQMIVDASPIISVILAFGVAKELDVRPLVESFIL